MLLSEYIKNLQTFLESNPDLELFITESGYYSEGKFEPELYDVPKLVFNGNVEVYSLGHSHQSY